MTYFCEELVLEGMMMLQLNDENKDCSLPAIDLIVLKVSKLKVGVMLTATMFF